MSISLHAVSYMNGHLVVVEDSDEDFDTFVEVARNVGITRTIHRAATGGDCLDLLRPPPVDIGAGLYGVPDLILMDLNSHGIDGREALLAIKSDNCLKDIPVVVLTTSANPKDVEFCYRAGANAYHVKPVRHVEYCSLLRDLLHYWLSTVTPSAAIRQID